MIISSHKQVEDLRLGILDNAEKSLERLKNDTQDQPALQFFGAIKFGKTGRDPLSGQPLNLVEQINQMYSDLVVLAGVRKLLDRHPGKCFELHMGPASGFDIQSTDGQVIAECFAATSVASNDKFNKDCKKLMNARAEYRYLFFYTHRDSEKMLGNRMAKYPEIQFEKITSIVAEKSPGS